MLAVVAAGIAGLIIGSFLNVCIYRLPRDLSVASPSRSFCPHCKKTIAWYDNIPVVGFVMLGGRCRHCTERISIRYPLVEALTGAAFVAVVLLHGLTLMSVRLCVFFALCIGLIFSDFEERILPDEFTVGGLALALIFSAFVPTPPGLASLLLSPDLSYRLLSLSDALIAAVVSGGALWAVGKLYEVIRHREGLGMGDVKMVAMIGAFLGLSGALLTLIVGSLAGSITGLLYIYGAKKDPASYELPFGSFLGLAAFLVALFGEFWFGL